MKFQIHCAGYNDESDDGYVKTFNDEASALNFAIGQHMDGRFKECVLIPTSPEEFKKRFWDDQEIVDYETQDFDWVLNYDGVAFHQRVEEGVQDLLLIEQARLQRAREQDFLKRKEERRKLYETLSVEFKGE